MKNYYLKKTIALLLAALLVFGLCGCGKTEHEGETNDPVIEDPEPIKEPTPQEIAASMQDYTKTVDYYDDNYLLLVNKTHYVCDSYWPEDLVDISHLIEGVGNANNHKMRAAAAEAFEALVDAAAAEGYKIAMRTGFRSYQDQKGLYDGYVARNGQAAADTFSARPGTSEHHTGYACDVSSPSVSWGLSYEYGETSEGKWLADHAHEYGFIIRYPQNKEEITGYKYEPWHIRYVGIVPATEMWEQGICLEEYLGVLN